MDRLLRLETIIRRAPLGIRLLDLARGTPVTDGMVVTAQRVGALQKSYLAERSPLSGIYGYRSLPGLRPFEVGEQLAVNWCSSPPDLGLPTAEDLLNPDMLHHLVGVDTGGSAPNFVVSIEDRLERFLPQTLLMCLPKERLLEVPLFSAPARPTPTGLAVIRGELWDRMADRAAGWAMVRASADGVMIYTAIADARGMFTLFMPYASALPPLIGSPPHGLFAIDQLTWPLTVSVFYQPSRQRRVASLPPAAPPDTRSILEQSAAAVYEAFNNSVPDVSGPAVIRPLRFGQELIVTTHGRDTLDRPHARLIVDPAP
jgi:hypothetical protein